MNRDAINLGNQTKSGPALQNHWAIGAIAQGCYVSLNFGAPCHSVDQFGRFASLQHNKFALILII